MWDSEEAISKFGFLGKHPTTGAAIANPFVRMSVAFQKQANILWYEIFDIVKQNCTTSFTEWSSFLQQGGKNDDGYNMVLDSTNASGNRFKYKNHTHLRN